MASDRFTAGQTVVVSHLQGDGRHVTYHGKVVKHAGDDTWLIEVPALGLFLTLEEKDLSNGS